MQTRVKFRHQFDLTRTFSSVSHKLEDLFLKFGVVGAEFFLEEI